jgi:formate hydrogenlyase subunit 6/NADH:ubiquinone oxidoreductase subunit I
MALRPEVDPRTCIACGECADMCAAKAITLVPDGASSKSRVLIDRERCIACFCCQETCPEGAIRISAGLAARLLGLGKR